MTESKIIAVDFDGTIVEDQYPDIGKPMIFAFDTLLRLMKDGHRLILWTFRSGKELDDAIEFCENNGIRFYAVNKNFPDEEYPGESPRKILADIFIDDRIIGGFPGWGKIYQMLNNGETPPPEKRRGLLGLFRK